MSKRKIMSLALSLCMVAILAVGGTLAFFVDTDAKSNVFTTGNVDITLIDIFEQNSKLVPSTGSAQAGTLKNGISKQVGVTNEGSEDAYVRVHIAIPAILDNGDPSFDAGKNVLHFNYAKESVGEGKWDWSDSTGAPYEGSYNYYEETIDGIDYNVYVVTYGDILSKGESTADYAMKQVYLDSKVTNEDIEALIDALGENWEIKVVAEGAQAEGFADAYEALNTAFGAPADHDFEWPTAETEEDAA